VTVTVRPCTLRLFHRPTRDHKLAFIFSPQTADYDVAIVCRQINFGAENIGLPADCAGCRQWCILAKQRTFCGVAGSLTTGTIIQHFELFCNLLTVRRLRGFELYGTWQTLSLTLCSHHTAILRQLAIFHFGMNWRLNWIKLEYGVEKGDLIIELVGCQRQSGACTRTGCL